MNKPAPSSATHDREAVLCFNNFRFAHISKLSKGAAPQAQAENIHGFYSRDARGVHLYKPSGELEAYLVANQHQGYFAVTAYMAPSGQTRYMHSTCSTTERWLALEGLGLQDQRDAIKGITVERATPGIGRKAGTGDESTKSLMNQLVDSALLIKEIDPIEAKCLAYEAGRYAHALSSNVPETLANHAGLASAFERGKAEAHDDLESDARSEALAEFDPPAIATAKPAPSRPGIG